MSAVNLLSPILNGGIQNVNFINGSVLTAENLTTERAATLQRQRLLGNCVGDGVGCGLEVTLSPSSVSYGTQVVNVTAGVAVNRSGDVLHLPCATDVTLTASLPTTSSNGGLFAPCQPPTTQLANLGIYVLTIMPASGYQGSFPVAQLNSGGVAVSCSSQYTVGGVQFRLAQYTLSSTSTLQSNLLALGNQIQSQLNSGTSAASLAPSLSQLRNGLAHVCFGTETLATYSANPFPPASHASSFDSYGLIDTLRGAGQITNCEVPLAIMYWTQSGIQFVDMWSVRRPVSSAGPSEYWPLWSGRRRQTEELSCFLQFQDQVQSILSGPTGPSTVAVDSYFLFLPPAGIIPVTRDGISSVTGTPATPALDMPTFFAAHASQDVATTDGDLLRGLFAEALDYEPIDLTETGKIQLYLVWENLQVVNQSGGVPLALLFASPALRYQGIARFGTAMWNLSRFAPRVI
jgi:hypothetical protein